MAEEVWVWVIYDHPSDYPTKYVARRQFAHPDGNVYADAGCHLSDTIEPLQHMMQSMGLTRLPRFPADDPVIVETWL